ncbi:hypothetical protein IM282_15625 [Enterobacter cloacae complex sp. P29RS]|uniref:hypothetical protein n=1 Tax=Enterobacter cloacae complex sp. P29RS TaxID=2779563 RepID=UPI00186942D1|nr:hypothetical protein [Enterobacter cloacae complex sp. P29RS]MBE3175407.1 hypothetical protein [Enterobacter cloacae complex sp. P29RS]
MKLKYISPLICIGAIALSGCNDPKDASEGNFKAAAQQYLDSIYPSCYFKANFPLKTDGYAFNNLPDILHVMSQKGLLTEKEISRKHYEASWGSKAHDVVVNSYDLTDEGKKFYKSDAAKKINGETLGGFCFGKATVSEVSNFTEPSDAMGQKISRVSFSYKVTGVPDWAKSSEITSLNSQLKKDVDSESEPLKVTSVFVLTNKGWVHERLFGK